MRVSLEGYEQDLVAFVADKRAEGSKDSHYRVGEKGTTEEHMARELNGAGAECAVAKALNRYWRASWGVGGARAKEPDVGRNTQVRWRSKSHYDLFVRPDDRDDQIFVLCLGMFPTYDVVGFITGAEAKRDEWKHEHGGYKAAYFVPQDALRKVG